MDPSALSEHHHLPTYLPILVLIIFGFFVNLKAKQLTALVLSSWVDDDEEEKEQVIVLGEVGTSSW